MSSSRSSSICQPEESIFVHPHQRERSQKKSKNQGFYHLIDKKDASLVHIKITSLRLIGETQVTNKFTMLYAPIN